MKKLLFVFVFAFMGVTSTYANKTVKQALLLKGTYNTENFNTCRSENRGIKKLSNAIGKKAGKCTVTVIFQSNKMDVKVAYTAATCAEALTTIKKIVDNYSK